MKDFATFERKRWIYLAQKPPNWLLHPKFSPKGNDAIDFKLKERLRLFKEMQKRAGKDFPFPILPLSTEDQTNDL